MRRILGGVLSAAIVGAAIAPSFAMAEVIDEGDDGLIRVQQGDDFYCRERNLGQWFYCEKPKPDPDSSPRCSLKAPISSGRSKARCSSAR